MAQIRVRERTKGKLEELAEQEGHSDMNGVVQMLITHWEATHE